MLIPHLTELLWLAAGFGLLIAGGEAVVRGAVRLAALAGISPLVIGLTVVAFCTSVPELAVSIGAAWRSQPDIVLGNVVGSNIFNVLFILGACAAIQPLLVARQIVRLDVPVMIVVSVVFWWMTANGVISAFEAVALLAGLVGYTAWVVILSRREVAADAAAAEAAGEPAAVRVGGGGRAALGALAWVAVGLAAITLGAQWVVEQTISLARAWGISELVISLTIVSVGTSLPEVATSIVATIRGQRDMAVGNVVGSCLFNILGIAGLATLAGGGSLAVTGSVIGFDLPVMTAVAVGCLPVLATGHLIARWEGAVFLGYYGAYALFLVLRAAEHDALPLFDRAMWWFVLPLTLLTFLILTYRAVREHLAARALRS